MPNQTKKKPRQNEELFEPEVGTISEEFEVPVTSELVFKKIWTVRKFHKTAQKREFIDSPIFKCAVNGMNTFWTISVRFWKGPNGKKVLNPVVICLNLTGCETEETGQARVRFQFGVWDASIRHWECCPISNVVLNLDNNHELLSVGYRSLSILNRHIDTAKDVCIMVKIQIIQSEEERHSLSQDMARILAEERFIDTVILCNCPETQKPLYINSMLIKTRSDKLTTKLRDHTDTTNKNIKYKIDLSELNYNVVHELIRYIYTDKVENTEAFAQKLLPLSTRFHLPGLTALCERTLLESLTPANVPSILLLADQCGCENLRKAALRYCENSEEIKGNVQTGKSSLAWRVMEMVNPDLFLEACESIGSSSSNLDSPGTPGSSSDF